MSLSVTNASGTDVVEVVNTSTNVVVLTTSAGAETTIVAPAPGNYSARVNSNGTISSSALFTVDAVPALNLASSYEFSEGFPISVAVNAPGGLLPDDRLRMDVLGQVDTCGTACDGVDINKVAAPSVTFDKSPKAGRYQMRLVRRGQTIAVKVFDTINLPTATINLWRYEQNGLYTISPPVAPVLTPGCIQRWKKGAYEEFSDTKQDPLGFGPIQLPSGIQTYDNPSADNNRYVAPYQACPMTVSTAPSVVATDNTTSLLVDNRNYFVKTTVIGRPAQPGDYVQIGNKQLFGEQPFKAAEIGNFAVGLTYANAEYHHFIYNRDTIINVTMTGWRKAPPAGTGPPICILPPSSITTVSNTTGKAPQSGFYYILNESNGSCSPTPSTIIFLDQNLNPEPNQYDAAGNPIPNGDRGIPAPKPVQDTATPPTPAVPPVPSSAKYFESGVSTTLNGSDGGCVVSGVGGSLAYGSSSQACLVVIPYEISSGIWSFVPTGELTVATCLAKSANALVIANPCTSATEQNTKFLDASRLDNLFQIKPIGTELCLTFVGNAVDFQNCSTDATVKWSQRWYDPTTNNPIGRQLGLMAHIIISNDWILRNLVGHRAANYPYLGKGWSLTLDGRTITPDLAALRGTNTDGKAIWDVYEIKPTSEKNRGVNELAEYISVATALGYAPRGGTSFGSKTYDFGFVALHVDPDPITPGLLIYKWESKVQNGMGVLISIILANWAYKDMWEKLNEKADEFANRNNDTGWLIASVGGALFVGALYAAAKAAGCIISQGTVCPG